MGLRRKPALTAREIWILIGIGAATLVVVNTLIGADILLSRSVAGGGSFFAGWLGARAIIWEHASPYGAAVVGLTQQLSYGRPAIAGENPYVLTIPFYLLPIYFPFALTASGTVARGLWIGLNQAALVGTAFLSLALFEWRPPRGFLIFYCILGVFGLYSVMALLDGSPTIILTPLIVAVLWAYGQENDELAGALLALSLFGWEAGGVFVLVVLLRVLQERRWNVLTGMAMVLVVLGLISFLIYPGWLLPFMAATLASLRASYGLTTQGGLELIFPHGGALAAQILTVLLLGMLIFEWWTGRAAGFRRFLWISCLSLAATPLLGLRTELSNLVILLPGACILGSLVLLCTLAGRRRSWCARPAPHSLSGPRDWRPLLDPLVVHSAPADMVGSDPKHEGCPMRLAPMRPPQPEP